MACTPAELKINYTFAIMANTVTLVATGNVIRNARRVITADGRVTCQPHPASPFKGR